MEPRLDSQLVEFLGRQQLVSELVRAGIEVAEPIRDRGVDLIAYVDKGDAVSRFGARPIQMKASSSRAWGINRKYVPFADLLMAYVWHVSEPARAVTYAMTHAQAVDIAETMGYANSPSWRDGGAYTTSNPSARLVELLEPHRMTSERWRALISASGSGAR
jgi:hypothetical protein